MAFGLGSRAWRWLAIIGAIAVAAWMVHVPMLRAAGWALVWADPVRKAEVIVVASWDGDAGALQVADLVRGGVAARAAVVNVPPDPAARILMTRGIVAGGERSWMVSLLGKLGVPLVDIIGDASGTEAEADIVQRWCTARNVRTAVIITTPDHSRRLRRLLNRTAFPAGTSFIVVPSGYSGFHADSWWKTRGGIRTEIVEFEKLALDWVEHPFN